MLLNTLKSLPRDLETTYDQIIQRINEKEIPSAQVILQWLVFGMSPLTPEDLAVIVTFNPSSGQFDSSLGLVHPDDVIQLCYSLVIKAANGTVQLAHASVKEYFIAQPRTILSNTDMGHASIAYCCLRYILLPPADRMQQSLLRYSAWFWPDHYRLSNKNSTLSDTATMFFLADDYFLTWVKIYERFNYHVREMKQNYHNILPLHYAVLLGLQDITKNLVASNQWHGVYDSTIQIAANGGHTGIVRILMEKGANVNAQGGEHGNALQAASPQGHAEIVRLLLDNGADVNAQGGKYSNALLAASLKGHAGIVRLLLDKGADMNTEGEKCCHALQTASIQGHAEIVMLLLEKGADANAPCNKHCNALQCIACCIIIWSCWNC